MAKPTVSFSEGTPASLSELQNNKPGVELVGMDATTASSLESALGIDEARGFGGGPRDTEHPKTKEILSATADEGTSSDLQAVREQLAAREAEITEMRSYQGKYGREVVGPMRAELEALKARVEAQASSPPPAAAQPAQPDPLDAYQRMFPEADVSENPDEAKRLGRMALSILDATERGTQAMNSQLLDEIRGLRDEISSVGSLAASGLNNSDVERLESEFDELKGLPKPQRHSLIRKLLDRAASGTPAAPTRDASGRFLPQPTPRPASEPAEFHVEGGSQTFAAPDMSKVSDHKAQLSAYKAMAADRKGGGANAATHVLIDMLRRRGVT